MSEAKPITPRTRAELIEEGGATSAALFVCLDPLHAVMAGLVPAIHVFGRYYKDNVAPGTRAGMTA
ncbi:hypothetical protein [Rhodopseudomonas sp. B29]|uniref:hypothetical protein n=1 Tax=Rhodopseudomonas sp. B29 TaxID=95607 RepID=UPI000344D61E|nr:hypothetical protein [Rhodopseudomonas sp. B29]